MWVHVLCCQQTTSRILGINLSYLSNAKHYVVCDGCSIRACSLRTVHLGSKLASCFQQCPAPGWLLVACSAYLIEESIVSHLDPRDMLLVRNVYLHYGFDVVAQELSGFKHLHPNLQRGPQDFPPLRGTLLSRANLSRNKQHSRQTTTLQALQIEKRLDWVIKGLVSHHKDPTLCGH